MNAKTRCKLVRKQSLTYPNARQDRGQHDQGGRGGRAHRAGQDDAGGAAVNAKMRRKLVRKQSLTYPMRGRIGYSMIKGAEEAGHIMPGKTALVEPP